MDLFKGVTTKGVFRGLYWLLLVGLIGYFLCDRFDAFTSGKATGFDVVVFLVWVALLLAPLYTTVEVLGVKLTRALEEVRKDVSKEIRDVKQELTSLVTQSNANTNTQTVYLQPPNEQKIRELEQKLEALSKTQPVRGVAATVPRSLDVNDEVVELFRIRYQIEQQLRLLAAQHGLWDNRPGVIQFLRILQSAGEINDDLAESTKGVWAICSRGIHGEDVSDSQRRFARNSGLEVLAALESLVQRL